MSFALVGGVVAVIIAFAWLAITYVYRDGPRRGMNPDQWAGVLALTAGLGIVLYLLRRPSLDEIGDPDDRSVES